MTAPSIPAGWDPTEKTIHRTFRTGSFDQGVRFVSAIGVLADAANHHPDIILTYPAVIVTLTTHDRGLVTIKDTTLAAQINRLWEQEFTGKAAGGHAA